MLFNTLSFWIFFGIVFALYLPLRRMGQNVLLLAASYFFYGCWSWRFLLLLVFSNTVDWVLARAIFREKDPSRAKRWVACSVAINLLFLGYFKYCNFFVSSLNALVTAVGLQPTTFHLDVVLPVGISFYTFQSMSYIIDVYRGELEPAQNPIDFALFVSFFPHMVAGPIMHSSALLPQMQRPRIIHWERIMSGFHVAMMGLFKKVVLADNMGTVVAPIFHGATGFQPGSIHLGVLAFAIQIYCDFSGYTDVARGVARMMGFTLMENFNHPYFSTCITDFWRRWHISLSSWLRDYLYVPLGGNRGGTLKTYRNLFVTMLLGGVWHGASWTFVIWGAYQGALLILERLFGGKKLIIDWFQAETVKARALWALRVLVCFHFVCLGWLIFRCEDTRSLPRMLTAFMDVRGWLNLQGGNVGLVLTGALMLLVLESFQYFTRDDEVILRAPWFLRVVLYTSLAYVFILGGRFESNPFIYFRF
jgi:alginate O-acetyltransferase complex protein AlgI